MVAPYVRRSACLAFLLISSWTGTSPVLADPPQKGRFTPLTNDKAWRHLPPLEQRLPVWALILAKPLPRTTAAMLELDYVHRTKCSLDSQLRAKLRWIAAATNRCLYSKRYAEADLLRAGMKKSEMQAFIRQYQQNSKKFAKKEAAAFAFARQMTKRAADIKDEEFAELLEMYGPKRVAAMVIVLAHASFQDRIFLALGISVESKGPLPPSNFRFASSGKPAVATPKRTSWNKIAKAKSQFTIANPQWNKKSIAEVQGALERQKARKPRLPDPNWQKAVAKLPPRFRRRRPPRVVWSRYCIAYQPELTMAWFKCMNAFGREAKLDRVFSNSMFWVITHANECFY